MREVVSGRAQISEIHEANFLLAGQSTSRSGSIVGIRLILECPDGDIGSLSEAIMDSNVKGSTNKFTLWSVDPLSELSFAALPMYRAEGIGEKGVFALNVEFSDGWAATGEGGTSVKGARENQAKETKNTLDLCKERYNSSEANPFMKNEALSLVVKDPRWFLIKKLEVDPETNEEKVQSRASGGCYQFSYDLKGAIDRLVDASEGTWWKPMSVGDSSLAVDCREVLETPENPMKWFHRNEESESRLEEALRFEKLRSNDDGLIEDMEYVRESIVSCEPPVVSLGMEDGAFPGDEKSLVRKVLRDWVVREFFHLMHSFLMFRNPRFWMNGRSEVRIFSGSLQ